MKEMEVWGLTGFAASHKAELWIKAGECSAFWCPSYFHPFCKRELWSSKAEEGRELLSGKQVSCVGMIL